VGGVRGALPLKVERGLRAGRVGDANTCDERTTCATPRCPTHVGREGPTFDAAWAKAVGETLDEWGSAEDDDAYADL